MCNPAAAAVLFRAPLQALPRSAEYGGKFEIRDARFMIMAQLGWKEHIDKGAIKLGIIRDRRTRNSSYSSGHFENMKNGNSSSTRKNCTSDSVA